jgi:hypothetical protein
MAGPSNDPRRTRTCNQGIKSPLLCHFNPHMVHMPRTGLRGICHAFCLLMLGRTYYSARLLPFTDLVVGTFLSRDEIQDERMEKVANTASRNKQTFSL